LDDVEVEKEDEEQQIRKAEQAKLREKEAKLVAERFKNVGMMSGSSSEKFSGFDMTFP